MGNDQYHGYEDYNYFPLRKIVSSQFYAPEPHSTLGDYEFYLECGHFMWRSVKLIRRRDTFPTTIRCHDCYVAEQNKRKKK
jgi:hypothetical protein